jgi:hypothetical protein
MHRWADDLRARLAKVKLDSAREAEIIEEPSQHLDSLQLRACMSSPAASMGSSRTPDSGSRAQAISRRWAFL